jgi:hypothetical protein
LWCDQGDYRGRQGEENDAKRRPVDRECEPGQVETLPVGTAAKFGEFPAHFPHSFPTCGFLACHNWSVFGTNSLTPLNVVARRLRVPVAWLAEEARAGRVPALAAGSKFLCDPAAVEAELLTRARNSQPKPTGQNGDAANA